MDDIETDSIQNTTDSEEQIIPYYKANKTTISMQKKEYYIKNKERLLQKSKCECGRLVVKNQMVRHRRSKIHQKYEELINRVNKDNGVEFN